MRLSFLFGSRLGDWLGLLRENGFRLSPSCSHHAALVTLLGLHNSLMHRREAGVDLTHVEVKRPLFILGHWRSGTTHLQYLLAQDPKLATPNTYEVCFPNGLLFSERTHGRLLAPFLPGTRIQDSMAFGMDVPNEDEIALAALGVPSPYLYWAFPRNEERYMRYLTFRDATESERRRFRLGLDTYLRKLTWKHGRPLVLKSPTHTARISILLDMYPDARFVHIHRDPVDVFLSTKHLYQSWYDAFAFIQRPDTSRNDDRIIRTYRLMYDAFLEERRLIPSGRYHEMSFEALERNPMAEMAGLYDALSLPGFPEERLLTYLASIGSYRKNAYGDPNPEIGKRLAREWARYFDEWGYTADRTRRRVA